MDKDKTFATLVTKLNSLLFAATLLEREPGESLDDDFLEVQRMEKVINESEIKGKQREALQKLMGCICEIYREELHLT